MSPHGSLMMHESPFVGRSPLDSDSSPSELDSIIDHDTNSMIDKIEDSDINYLNENDRINALEFNGECLPEDFLLAKFSLTRDHKKAYLDIKEQRKNDKDELRLNSEY